VQVDVVPEVGAVANGQGTAAVLDLEPRSGIDRDVVADADTVDATQNPGGDDDRPRPDLGEGAAPDEGRRESADVPPDRRR